jgi:hypothetical protein
MTRSGASVLSQLGKLKRPKGAISLRFPAGQRPGSKRSREE